MTPDLEQRKWKRIFNRFRSSDNYQAALCEKKRFKKPRPITRFLKLVANCKYPDGTKHPHAKRVPIAALKAGKKELLKNEPRFVRDSFDNFHELHQFLAKLAESINGLGELTVYDWACRIGFRLKLYPDFIYLHRGTNKGARAIRPKIRATKDGRTRYLQIADLPKPIQMAMNAFDKPIKVWELEDILCIYKRRIRKMYPKKEHAARLSVRARQ